MIRVLKEAFSQKENTWAKEPVKAALTYSKCGLNYLFTALIA